MLYLWGFRYNPYEEEEDPEVVAVHMSDEVVFNTASSPVSIEQPFDSTFTGKL